MKKRNDLAGAPIKVALALTAALATLATPLAAFAALHPGDKVNVLVFNHPELSASPTLDAQGNITLPLAGSINASSLDTRTLAERIRQRLSPYVRAAAVNVQLDTQSTSIFVAGGPGGTLRYQPGETLTSVLDELQLPVQNRTVTASAVNPHDEAPQAVQNGPLDLQDGPVNFHSVSILRDNRVMGPYDLIALRASGQPGPALVPDDTIKLVNKPVIVHVTGDVAQPGTAYLDRNDPLSRALDQVGGPLATATQVSLQLQRNGNAQTVSMGSPELSAPAQSGDTLLVPRAARVDVLGIVDKPGETLLRGNDTLVSAIYYAGGPAKYANLRAVQVTHNGVKTQYDLYKLSKGATGMNPRLADGDVVFVPQGSTFDPSSLFQALGTLGYLFRL